MSLLKRDKAKLQETLERAKKAGDFKMVQWCEKHLKYYRRVK